MIQTALRRHLVVGRLLQRCSRQLSSYPAYSLLPMPALSPTMTQGNLGAWQVKEGEEITAGSVICEIETDKATVDFEAQDDVYLAKILVPAGTQNIMVGDPIGITVEEAADAAKFADFVLPKAEVKAPEAAPEPVAEKPTPPPTPKVAPTPPPVAKATPTPAKPKKAAPPTKTAAPKPEPVANSSPLKELLASDRLAYKSVFGRTYF